MRFLLSLLLCFALTSSSFAADADKGYFVTYSGGSLSTIKSKSFLRLFIERDQIRIRYRKQNPIVIPVAAITQVSYSQDSRRRIQEAAAAAVFTLGIGSILALSKSKNHFIGITWDNPAAGDKGGFAVEVQKGDYRGVLLALEGITGKQAVDLDQPAAAVPSATATDAIPTTARP
jgi:hypothetical protein